MKSVEKKKSIHTIPDGVWESNKPAKKQDQCSKTTDLQGNGYPHAINKRSENHSK